MAFIKLDRKFFDSTYWNQQRSFSFAEAWIDLIQSARFEASTETKLLANGREISIKRGEIHASLRYLAKRWGWGVDKTKRFIDKAKKNKEIEHRSEQGESIIKLCNYEVYNSIPNTDKYSGKYTDQTQTSTPTDTNNIGKERKESKERKEQTNKNVLGKHSDFFKSVLKFFSIVSEHHERNVFSYLMRLKDKNKIDEFVNQTNAMMKWKIKNPDEKRSNWKNYVYDFDSGNSTDWVGKINPPKAPYKPKQKTRYA